MIYFQQCTNTVHYPQISMWCINMLQIVASPCNIVFNLLQDLLTYTTSEIIMTENTLHIRQWVMNCHNHLNNQQKAAKLWAKL